MCRGFQWSQRTVRQEVEDRDVERQPEINGRTLEPCGELLAAPPQSDQQNIPQPPVDLETTHVLLHSSSVSKRFLFPLQPPYQNWAQALACRS